MSARQRARILKKNAIALSDHELESPESSEEEAPTRVATTKTFQFDSSDSSDNESNRSNDENSHESQVTEKYSIKSDAIAHRSKVVAEKKVESYDEMEYLESLIEDNVATEKERDTSMESLLFRIDDVKQLDVSAVLRRRQGQQAMFDGGLEPVGRQGGNGARNRGLGRGPAASLSAKKVLFGAPSEDWPRPPAFVAGGLGMSRVKEDPAGGDGGVPVNSFTFEWSPEFRFLHSQYQFVQSTGDANILVMFLAHFPHHPQALMELSRVYGGLGQPDKSADLVRRALYVLECASMEAFKPSGALTSRLDPGRPENAVYFEVLHRHMQLCGTQGCHGVAMEVCRYLVALWPADTSHMLLLVLDHYLLMANRHDLMLAYCGLSKGCDDASSSSADDEMSAAMNFSFASPYRFSSPSPSTNGAEGLICEASLQDLPNWWFSLALSAFSAEHRRTSAPPSPTPNRGASNTAAATEGTEHTSLPSATVMLKAALLRWPFMLRPLLLKMGVDVGTSSVVALITGTSPAARWRKMLSHELFGKAYDRFHSQQRGYLDKASEVYALRNAPLWAREEEAKWLLRTCTELVAELGEPDAGNSTFAAYLESQGAHSSRYSQLLASSQQDTHLTKYEHARVNDYSDAVPRFPDDLNPLDPSLDDIQYVLSGAVRFREFMDQEGRFLFPVPEPYVTTVKVPAGGAARGGRAGNGENNPAGGLFGGLFGAPARAQRTDRPNIDLNLPLMQLFLATIFPWIFVPPAVRN